MSTSKAVSSEKDAVFEATSKLKEKKISLSCFDQVPQGTNMPLFQVPSSSVVDVFPGVSDSAKCDTQHKDQNMFLQCCLEDPLFAQQVQSPERLLRVRERVSAGQRGDPNRGQREGAVACSVSEPGFRVSVAGFNDDLVTGNCVLDEGIDGVRSVHGGCRRSGCAGTARATAGESGIDGLLEESESDFSKNLAESTAADECADSPGRVRSAHATAGESDEIVGSSVCLSWMEFPSLN